MARYIDVEPLEEKLKEHIRKTESELMLGALSTFVRLLDITPTADVVPIKHGDWKEQKIEFIDFGGDVVKEKTLWRCSVCGHEDSILTNYCSKCGARMDGDDDEIDADALLKVINQTCSLKVVSLGNLVDIIGKQPTVDAVPVVKCKDCVYRVIVRDPLMGTMDCYGCKVMHYNEDDWFCSFGERKDDE